MANRVQIRHGSSKPTINNLLPYELGWDETHHALYINNNGTIRKISGEGLFLPLTGGTLSGDLSVTKAGTVKITANNTSQTHSISLYVNSNSNAGLYDDTNSKWIVYCNSGGNVTLNGNANSATKAAQDGNGDTISSTYLKLTGGTLSGDLTITAAGAVKFMTNNTSQSHQVNFGVSADGTGGVWDATNSKWVVSSDTSGNVVLNGGAQQIITKGSVGTRSIYITTTALVPSGAVAGDIVLVKV